MSKNFFTKDNFLFPNDFFKGNRTAFAAELPENAVAVLSAARPRHRNGDQDFPYRQDSDFFYLTGLNEENAFLVIDPSNSDSAKREVLFIEPYSERKTIWVGECMTASQASDISGCENVMTTDDFKAFLDDVAAKRDVVYRNSELDFDFEGKKTVDSHEILKILRLVKKDVEIKCMRHACHLTETALARCASVIRPGMYEFELQAELEYEFRKGRAAGHAFHPIVAGGRNACCLHYSKNASRLNDGDLVLFDVGCEYMNYAADLSRTMPVNGRFTARQKECYDAVNRVAQQLKNSYTIGKTIKDINDEGFKMMEEEMISLGLFARKDVENQDKDKPMFRKYLPHGLTHHIGLDVHDSVDISVPFKSGMILSCEPGIYIREENIGIRIENDILVTDNGPVDMLDE